VGDIDPRAAGCHPLLSIWRNPLTHRFQKLVIDLRVRSARFQREASAMLMAATMGLDLPIPHAHWTSSARSAVEAIREDSQKLTARLPPGCRGDPVIHLRIIGVVQPYLLTRPPGEVACQDVRRDWLSHIGPDLFQILDNRTTG